MTLKQAIFVLSAVALLPGCGKTYVANPDPNHTHADFAVWVDGEKMDFSTDELMSGLSADPESHDEEHEHLHPYLHLHDNVGHVIHRHKPGLTVGEFFDSINIAIEETCYVSTAPLADGSICSDHPFRMFVRNPASSPSWKEIPVDLTYAFDDMDQIVLTTAGTDDELRPQLDHISGDACLYSKTCPWRGEPPAENCIADPAVPCIE